MRRAGHAGADVKPGEESRQEGEGLEEAQAREGSQGASTTKSSTATRTVTARSARLFPVPVFSSLRRAGPIGLALTAWDIWRRIPKKHRRAILHQARKHGPTVATKLMQQRQRRRRP